MKKVIAVVLSVFFVLVGILPTSSVFAEENNSVSENRNQVSKSVTTVYDLVPASQNKDLDVSAAASSYGTATVTCTDGGHGIAHCNTKYSLVNDKISKVATTVYIYMPGGISVDSKRETIFHGSVSSTVYSQVEMYVGAGTYYSELWGTVYGLKGAYNVNNVASRTFTVR
ncbi:hypothetical protein [Bacillus multifaciens]|uniref:hypothetical protein n=1 Tax=Bacillus multifaciens TaxID=3068506 RepID=UPI00274052BB|nr:hypothetical protein [Bacillus sp. WLY-B-L8]MDP7981185.1 hypothetical protein [Bacillus sp. WLY-B-L8]HDX9589323.1 hypothetical protein [Bacillus pseudomycoides]